MKEETDMSTMLLAFIREGRGAKLVPWLLARSVVLYFAGYVDSSVHGAALGSPAILGAVHEVFHHARHVVFMCH